MSQARNRVGLLLGIACVVSLAGAAAAQMGATTPLAGFGDFSGAETQEDFDDLGLVNGDDVASVGDVGFQLTVGGPAKFFEDPFPRDSGPAGVGSIDNFWGFVSPYPDLEMAFAQPVHRVAFELRANVNDDVSVTLLSNGAVLDELTVPSRGSDAFYFYGYENAAGFDQVLVDVVANASGAFSLDNLTFESLGVAEPPEEPVEVVSFACQGFEVVPPPDPSGHRPVVPFRALLAQLTDQDGNVVDTSELPVPPVVRVVFTPDGSAESEDVTADAVWSGLDSFTPVPRGRWLAWLSTWQMLEPGVYMTVLESGDPSSYGVDPTCVDWNWVEDSGPAHGWRHRRRHHGRR